MLKLHPSSPSHWSTIAKSISAVRCRSLGPRCSPYPIYPIHALPWRSDGGRVAPPLGGSSRPRRPSPPTAAPQGAAARGPPPLPHTLRDAEHGLAAGRASLGPSPPQPPSPSLHASPWPRAPLAGRAGAPVPCYHARMEVSVRRSACIACGRRFSSRGGRRASVRSSHRGSGA
ncbi:hypothetical protein PVAP13_5NG133181 [Panicum virgatum]|uniref:Uncharacterized protein n=1 Tax=Panicum virgatum TaxID=38727 RepID=A0A8T0RRY7_PANVG|nr:hypothetical protein PVAP13_5NG133181 [Panicum virgatum]